MAMDTEEAVLVFEVRAEVWRGLHNPHTPNGDFLDTPLGQPFLAWHSWIRLHGQQLWGDSDRYWQKTTTTPTLPLAQREKTRQQVLGRKIDRRHCTCNGRHVSAKSVEKRT